MYIVYLKLACTLFLEAYRLFIFLQLVLYSACRAADGDMGHRGDVLQCYMKQKHRMIWERRHGPVGSGRKKSIEPEH